MLVIRLIPSICRCGLPIFLQTLFVSLTYTFNLIWINHQHNDSLDIIIGCSFGSTLFIIFSALLLTSITKTLNKLTVIALACYDFVNVGIILQRNFFITNLLFIIIACLFCWSDYLLSLITSITILDPQIITITSTYLIVLLFGLYPLSIYYNIAQFLFSQNLIKYTLSFIAIFGILVEFFALNIFDNGNDLYMFDVAALSITFTVQCIIIISLSMLHCCGCNTYKNNNYNEHKYLLQPKQKQEQEPEAELQQQPQGSPTSSQSQSTQSVIQNPWFFLPTWKGWDLRQMFNPIGNKQIILLTIKHMVIHCSYEWIVYFALILLPATISSAAFLSNVLVYNFMNILLVIPISLHFAMNELIIINNINDIWDTVIALWLFIICVLIVIIYVFVDSIIKLYIPYSIAIREYDLIYNDLHNISIPWMCLFVVLYGAIIINHAIYKRINLELKGFGLFNLFIFILVGIPLCLYLISSSAHNYIPDLLSSLNGIWCSLCICCIMILSLSIYKRCTIDWRYQSNQYLKRKRKEKKRYVYQIQLQKRYKCKCKCCFCCKNKKIHNQQQNQLTIVNNKKSAAKKYKKIKKKVKKKRYLKQVASWSSLDGNPYYQSSEYETVDNDEALLLKTDSDEEDVHNNNGYDTFEQYVDGLDALADADEISSSKNSTKRKNNSINNNNNDEKIEVLTATQFDSLNSMDPDDATKNITPIYPNDDMLGIIDRYRNRNNDNINDISISHSNTVTIPTMDSMEEQQLLDALTISSTIQHQHRHSM